MRHALASLLLAWLGLLPAQAAEPLRVLPASGLGTESAALLMSGQQGGEISFTALALPIFGEDGKARVLIRLRMEGPELLADQTQDILRIETSLYALGTGGGVQGSVLETIEIDLASMRSAVESDGVDLLASLALKPGAYTLRLLARNLDTGRLGVRTLPLPVPEIAGLDPAAPLALSPPPAGGDSRPTARSVGLGPLDPPPFPDDPLSQSQAAAMAPPVPLPAVPDTAEGRKLRSAVRAAYREALSRWAAGRETDALAALESLEDSLLARKGKPVTAEQIIEIETEAARELATADAAVLTPLLRLHQRLYEKAREKTRRPGSSMAREVAARLTALSRELGHPEIAHRFAAVFGVELIRGGVTVQGGQMLQSVLAEDPGDEGLLLELSSNAERRNAPAEAIAYLDTLLRVHPENREARLRRALDRARLGQTSEAEKELRTFIQEETGGWRLSLAYQELARLQIVQKTPGATQTLREGLARLPGDEKLTLLLASLLDGAGRGMEARQLLASFKPQESEGSGGAARRRYSSPPDEPFLTRNAELGREAAAHLPALAAALKKTAP